MNRTKNKNMENKDTQNQGINPFSASGGDQTGTPASPFSNSAFNMNNAEVFEKEKKPAGSIENPKIEKKEKAPKQEEKPAEGSNQIIGNVLAQKEETQDSVDKKESLLSKKAGKLKGFLNKNIKDKPQDEKKSTELKKSMFSGLFKKKEEASEETQDSVDKKESLLSKKAGKLKGFLNKNIKDKPQDEKKSTEPKKSMFSGLFKKKEEMLKREEKFAEEPEKIATPSNSSMSIPKMESVEQAQEEKEEEASSAITFNSAVETKEKPKEEKKGLRGLFKKKEKAEDQKIKDKKKEPQDGNAFTNIFQEESKDNDFIGNIIESTQEKEAGQFGDITSKFKEESERVQEEEEKIIKLSHIAQVLTVCSLFIPLTSYVFYSVKLNPESSIADFFSMETPGKTLQEKQKLIEKEKSEIVLMTQESEKYDLKIENLTNNKIRSEILDQRINWLGVITEIEKMTNDAFYNDLTNSVVYTGYSGRSEKSEISVQGEVRDPSGKSMTQLAMLVDLINANEKFSGAEVRNFTKTEDEDGIMTSSFNLSFEYKSKSQKDTKNPLTTKK
ncbi:MAG: hypothetical protein N4A36_01955 [Candidatus Gracilibacteria bacterium]|jgi:hypothetical protein|nr:hypothetical protein [Candidatus Gracilibacteria bacterium]